MGDDASTAADVKPPASATAATVAANSVGVASVRDLDALTLAAPHVDAAKLLEIITELRQTAGAKTVNTAIAKVMRQDPSERAAELQKQHNKVKKPKQQKKSRGREFSMSNYKNRFVAIKFLYLGERFAGFARQDHMEDTVERYLIDALVRTKLIEGDIEQCNYSRCGRTDRGVSAFGQVIGVTLRSNLPINAELVDHASIDDVRPGTKFRIKLPSGDLKTITEVDYPTHINRALPEDIRVYSVISSPTPDFSARFDCKARMYRYFFLKKDMDIAKMRAAAQDLVGKHDFRNFCRIDTNVHTFERAVMSFEIVKCEDHVAVDPGQQMYRCEVYGRAFLWHQVRCMVQVLFLIASGKEEQGLVKQLLDIEQTPRKPQYDMAPDAPLVLHDCYFDENVQFEYSPLALHQVYDQLSAMWEQHCIKGAILRSNLDAIAEFPVTYARVTRELDHYAPTLGQLLVERGCGPTTSGPNRLRKASEDGEEGSGTDEPTFAWKSVAPLLPLASRRRQIPLLTRDTGDSVDEKKSKVLERKRRREEPSPSPAAITAAALAASSETFASSSSSSVSEGAAGREEELSAP
ncbi:hypothetical protein Gpo141_00009393 [Globisporangium polare]